MSTINRVLVKIKPAEFYIRLYCRLDFCLRALMDFTKSPLISLSRSKRLESCRFTFLRFDLFRHYTGYLPAQPISIPPLSSGCSMFYGRSIHITAFGNRSCAKIARAVRAILLAIATMTTFAGRRWRSDLLHTPLSLALNMTAPQNNSCFEYRQN